MQVWVACFFLEEGCLPFVCIFKINSKVNSSENSSEIDKMNSFQHDGCGHVGQVLLNTANYLVPGQLVPNNFASRQLSVDNSAKFSFFNPDTMVFTCMHVCTQSVCKKRLNNFRRKESLDLNSLLHVLGA